MDCKLIVAMTAERLIGRHNDLPWHWPEDLAHFKRSTKGGVVVMGRRSFESLGGKALPKRTNLVVSRSQGADAGPDGREDGRVRIFGDLPSACAWVERTRPAPLVASGAATGEAAGEAGADHVCLQPLVEDPTEPPMDQYRELAAALLS